MIYYIHATMKELRERLKVEKEKSGSFMPLYRNKKCPLSLSPLYMICKSKEDYLPPYSIKKINDLLELLRKIQNKNDKKKHR